MDVIILAGGKGTRMGSDLPKPLVPVGGKPMLGWQIGYLKDLGGKIILSIGHKSELIVDYVMKNYPDEKIEFAVEKEALGTGGALNLAIQKAESDHVLVLNCDDITNIPLGRINDIKQNSIFVTHPTLPFGLVKEDEEGNAIFTEKPVLDEWVSCGWYVFDRKGIIEHLPEKGSLEYDVFPKIKIKVEKHKGNWFPLNTKKDVIRFENSLEKL